MATGIYLLSFRDTSPHVAQRVTQELAALFLNESVQAPRSSRTPLPLHTATEQLATEIAALQAKLTAVEQQPGDNRALAAVTHAYQQAVAKYRALRERSLYAEQAQLLARERQGARFLLLQSPRTPTPPDVGQRLAWLGVGLLLAVAASLAPFAWLERLGSGLRGLRAIQSAAPIPLLGVIPYIETAPARQARVKRTLIRATLAALLALAAMIIFHRFVMPLDALGLLLGHQSVAGLSQADGILQPE